MSTSFQGKFTIRFGSLRKEWPVYWESINGDSRKFWAAHIIERHPLDTSPTGSGTNSPKKQYVLVRRWGRIGTKGQSMEQIMYSREEAEEVLGKLIYVKELKGYRSKF